MGELPVLLVVEDDPPLNRTYSRLFDSDQYELVVTSNIKETRQAFEHYQARIRVLLVDQNLPDGSGTDFAEEISAKFPGTHIVILTGAYVVYESRFEVITKPFSFMALQARMLELLAP
jgi:DNA-binding response OmpR family regulator